ncbi:MAG: class I SAM-dependent methyltransferase, partial [Deltaproteobacteria bacterium]|nr:class I SAM-dependent methyltransferase [Deltaproteobacteria bacterium]
MSNKGKDESGIPRLEFSEKYDEAQARCYFEKHGKGFGRRLSNWRETVMLQKALKLAGNPKTVLDLPAGTGRFWEMLSGYPDRKIYAADYSNNMLAMGLHMRPEHVTRRIRPLKCSAFSIPLADGAVESVFCARLLHHIGEREDRRAMLCEMARVASQSICVSLWIDGNYKARRRRKLEARRTKKHYQNRFVVKRSVIEEDFRRAGLKPIERIDFMKFYSMWSTYVLRKVDVLVESRHPVPD